MTTDFIRDILSYTGGMKMLNDKDVEAISLILREHKAEIMHEMSVMIENTFGPRLQTIIDELKGSEAKGYRTGRTKVNTGSNR